MMGAERLARIREAASENGFISVREIMDMFQVSRSSAMRDLDELEKEGFLIRRRGGGVLKERATLLTPANERPVVEKVKLQDTAKKAIAQEAAKLLEDGQCIFLAGGTTIPWLVRELVRKNVTIVTPNTYLLEQLPDDYGGRVYLIGGDWQNRYSMSYGPLARAMVERFRFDIAFISCNGMEPESDVSVFDFGVGDVKKAAMEKAARSVLLADSTKYASKAMCVFADASDFDAIYTDRYPLDDIPDNVILCESEEKKDENE